jgi:hypothetical protein
MDDDYGIALELFLFASNIKKQVYGVLNYSFHLKYIWKRIAQNMFFLMLDPRFKSFCLVSLFIDHEHSISIVEEYAIKSL